MRSLERRFKIISQKNPHLSSLICFEHATAGQGFQKRTLYFWFNRLVEKEDYDQKEKRRILQELAKPKPP